ncbi:MAG TPA: hypothetical protein VHA37_01465 [Candidatus Saccharimonadales bacterium]|nr:hypothetical protein [Candidatus Saccharimonadales bacterium]
MFGHQDHHDDKHDDQQSDGAPADVATAVQDASGATDQPQGQPDQNTSADTGAHDNPGSDSAPAPAEPTDASADTGIGSDDNTWQHPGTPIDDSPEQISDIIAPAGGHQPHPFPPHPASQFHHDSSSSDNSENRDAADTHTPHELIEIKQKALGQLTPLIDELDQSPEDRFRTVMMMLQASDDQSLVKLAYESANAIEDEKVRAQALLDVVNEINYFTQHPDQEE